jgi:hypothetical protein
VTHVYELLGIKGFVSSLLIFAVAPGALLRVLLTAWPKGDPVRAELLADLAMLRFRDRPFFVAAQIPNAVCDGLGARLQETRRSRAIVKAARLSFGRTYLARSEICWVAPNGDLVPVEYDGESDAMTFTTTPYVSMMPAANVGDQTTMLFKMHYLGPTIRPTRRARLKSNLFGREARRHHSELRDQMLADYVNQFTRS